LQEDPRTSATGIATARIVETEGLMITTNVTREGKVGWLIVGIVVGVVLVITGILKAIF
jgi:hypothetical protein